MLKMYKFIAVCGVLIILVCLVWVFIPTDVWREAVASHAGVSLAEERPATVISELRMNEEGLPVTSVPPLPPAPFVENPVRYNSFMIQELRHGWIVYRLFGGHMLFVPKPEFMMMPQRWESHD
ncbi:MAG: hypothetical protein LBB66_04460 [Desulfovibrio sp.]|jgi:hypothetical protein|nr:hypothetical protein [Desulfovibrio sp.]